MAAYYNEIDPYPAQWLRNLITAKLIPAGEVDERNILDVQPDDLTGFEQCHFFAGIGGWPFALAQAGWPEGREVWTGSCPCQPLSSAGLRKGHADERHLWPAFYRLIAERRPATIFGEQVASKDGREWLAGIRADLEACGYAFGAADLPAAGVGSPHVRQRLYWMGDAAGTRLQEQRRQHRASSEGRSGLTRSAMQADPHGWNGGSHPVECSDGQRRVASEPTSFPLADGVHNRTGRLRAYGNAIVPQVGAAFVSAALECLP